MNSNDVLDLAIKHIVKYIANDGDCWAFTTEELIAFAEDIINSTMAERPNAADCKSVKP